LKELVSDLNSGEVSDLFILDTNPVYEAPADLDFASAIKKAAFRVHAGLYKNETSKYCSWQLPLSHYLESWGDGLAFDGTATVIQPLIRPLYSTKSMHEIVGILSGDDEAVGHKVVQDYWKSRSKAIDFKTEWDRILHDGWIRDSAFKTQDLSLRADLSIDPEITSGLEDQLEVIFRPDPYLGVGRYSNNGWLQELPKPLTRLTWDNAVLVSPATAKKLGLQNGQMVELEYEGAQTEGPAWILPGHAPNSVTLHMGYGRSGVGKIADENGFNVNRIRTAAAPLFGLGLKVQKTGKSMKLASTQDHHAMHDRHLIRTADKDDYEHHPDFAQHVVHVPKPTDTLYKPEEHLKADNQWAMTIDLNACVGCGACTVACQSENNIPVVGKEEVANGRELHWIRVDRYYSGDLENPETSHQPVPCMQCENAPCEPVCPVGATTHSPEG